MRQLYTEISRAYRKAAKQKDVAAMRYYNEALTKVACANFNRFKTSWAGEKWMELHDKIMAALDELGLQVFTMMAASIVAFEVSKIVGKQVTYQQIESAVEARRLIQ